MQQMQQPPLPPPPNQMNMPIQYTPVHPHQMQHQPAPPNYIMQQQPPPPPSQQTMAMNQVVQPPMSHSVSPHPSTPNSISSSGPLPTQQSPHPIMSHSPHPGSVQMHPHMQPPNQQNSRPSSLGPPSMTNNIPPQSPHQFASIGEPPQMQNFYSSGPPPMMQQQPPPPAGIPQPQNTHPYHQPGPAPLPMHNPHMQPPMSMQQLHHPQQTMIHQRPPVPGHHPQNIHMHSAQFGRNSPYAQNMLQTELRIVEFNRRIQSRPILRQPGGPLPNHHYDESIWWEKFASEFFDDDATLTIRILEDKPFNYTIGRTLIPRFFRSYFDGGVSEFSINLRNVRETVNQPNLITLECDRAIITTTNNFRHPALSPGSGLVIQTEGNLCLDFVSNNFEPLLIRSWRFLTTDCRDFIDRSILTAMGYPNSLPVEPASRLGLTKSTVSYLKMCMIIEPMQDLMSQHKLTNLAPRECLRKILADKYKYRSPEDNRAPPNKRTRKRKTPGAAANLGTGTSKRSKANAAANAMASNPENVGPNNVVNNQSYGMNTNSVNTNANNINSNNNSNNVMISPGAANYNLTSQDVMVVGEPSMMGGEFGDDNERMITRLKNTQYEQPACTPMNSEESENAVMPMGDEKCLPNNGSSENSNAIDTNLEGHNIPHSKAERLLAI